MSILQQSSVNGQINLRQRVTGKVTGGVGKIFKELKFMPFSDFPEVGDKDTLYVDTENDSIYYYDERYIVLSSSEQAQIIDDLSTVLNKTWSSLKINSEFQTDRNQIEELQNTVPISNSEIEAMLSNIL